jgi:hypothetical protein
MSKIKIYRIKTKAQLLIFKIETLKNFIFKILKI